MRACFAAALAAVLMVLVPAQADVAAQPLASQQAQKATPPWVAAQALLDKASPDLARDGVRALAPYADQFEAALAESDKPFDDGSDAIVLLVDGKADELAALAAVQKALPDKKAVVIPSPYPAMALLLGSYYNEIGRFADGLRVLEAQKARDVGTFGDHCAALTSERAVSLAQLHRLPESLAVYEEGLKLDNIDDKGKARMQRGRGYVLTEMNRLDEAEAAYKESLTLEPGNRIALGELDYIARVKAGGQPTQGQIVTPKQN